MWPDYNLNRSRDRHPGSTVLGVLTVSTVPEVLTLRAQYLRHSLEFLLLPLGLMQNLTPKRDQETQRS